MHLNCSNCVRYVDNIGPLNTVREEAYYNMQATYRLLISIYSSRESQLVESQIMPYSNYRPGSSFTRFNQRPLSVKLSDPIGRLTSARIRAQGRGRLAPLERAKTPSVVK